MRHTAKMTTQRRFFLGGNRAGHLGKSLQFPLSSGEDNPPVPLHVHNCPASLLCFVEALVETTDARFSVIGPFALAIGVVDVECESRALSGSGPLQHLQVTVGVAERCNGSSADLLVTAS